MSKKRLTWKQVEANLKKIIASTLEIDHKKLSLNTQFIRDLGVDSLKTIEIIAEVEKMFKVIIPENDIAWIKTIGDIIRLFINIVPHKVLSMVQMKVLCMSLRPDKTIEVMLQIEDGSWTYADGKTILPSSLCLLTFSRWSLVLKELEHLINDPKTNEADLQGFFEQYPELIAGDEYDTVIPQASIRPIYGTSIWRADFVLSPYNQTEFAKVLELKIPSLRQMKRPLAGHVTFAAKVWSAIRQLRDYGVAFDTPQVREQFKKKYGIDVFKPDLHLVVGRKWDIVWLDSIRKLRKDTPVKIEDWDSVVERLKRKFIW